MRFPVNDVRCLFDAVVHSMDFGSGFLHEEEVRALRSIAERLGLDPDEATPTDFRGKFGCALNNFEKRYLADMRLRRQMCGDGRLGMSKDRLLWLDKAIELLEKRPEKVE